MRDGRHPAEVTALPELRRRLDAMTSSEIAAALNEIHSLALDEEERILLEAMLVEPLIEKDPALLLTRFADRIGNDEDGVGRNLSWAMASWVGRDVADATAWFDGQIAAGAFEGKSLDGRSQARLEFEAVLVASLLEMDFEAAGRRIEALPEDQRREALEQISFSEISATARANYARLVRGLVPEDERAGSFAEVISDLVAEGGYAGVERFLDDIRAKPEERLISARKAANARLHEIAQDRVPTSQDIDTMRAWVEKQAPGSVDRITGEAIAEATQDGGGFDFEEASRLVLEYHRKSSTDDVLVEFLERFAARSNLEQALPLVRQIRDPELREEILGGLNQPQ